MKFFFKTPARIFFFNLKFAFDKDPFVWAPQKKVCSKEEGKKMYCAILSCANYSIDDSQWCSLHDTLVKIDLCETIARGLHSRCANGPKQDALLCMSELGHRQMEEDEFFDVLCWDDFVAQYLELHGIERLRNADYFCPNYTRVLFKYDLCQYAGERAHLVRLGKNLSIFQEREPSSEFFLRSLRIKGENELNRC